jgi:pyrophosphatase PpaX
LKYLEFYYQRNLEICKPFPHASEVLEELKSKGYALGLLSNKESRAGFQEIEFSGLAAFFDVIAFREQVPELKPRPGGLLWMLERLNVSPHEAIYIGDEPRDIQSAQLAGTKSGAALWGSLHPNELRAIGPTLEWKSLKAFKDSL